ncbi:unnamed protein product [Bursaphelenchus xylophilus]|nr:unnamed protein product [Bursaphelenchus xylophilus]CAG9098088.1 unnamed protein product [Bursaphelenchus xylophilus]
MNGPTRANHTSVVAWLGVLLMLFEAVTQASEARDQVETLQELTAKKCFAGYECWRAEPVTDEGLPFNLMNRFHKRLDIGNGRRQRGATCRCRQGRCAYYNIPTQTYFHCQEF